MKLYRLMIIATLLVSPAFCSAEPPRADDRTQAASASPAGDSDSSAVASQPAGILSLEPSATSAPSGTESRAMPSPLNSPPFPSSDYAGPIIGVPDAPVGYPLMSVLYNGPGGKVVKESRIKFYGWVEGSFNSSTSHDSNAPEGYALIPDRPEVQQFIARVERVPDTAQVDHADWGFRLTNLYGTDYRTTIAKGWFSRQLLEKNELYGFDMPEAYFIFYFPSIGEGTTLKLGRFFSPVDIESVTAPDNYLFTHSIMNMFDAVTFTGALADIRLNKNWAVELGVHAGSDMTPWDDGALNGHAMVRWVSDSNNDSIWAGANSIGSGKYRFDHDNLQQLVAIWSHKFNEKVHTATEVYYQWQRDAFLGGSVNYGPVRRFGGGGGPGFFQPGISDSVGAVNYLQVQLSGKDYVSLRTDYLWDDQGQRTGLRNSYWSETLGWSHNLTDWAVFRPEIRYEKSFNLPAYDLGNKSSQFMFGIDLILRF